MSKYAGYPVSRCPTCGSGDQVVILGPEDRTREFGPGERAVFGCGYCDAMFTGVVPEPLDGYQGDGVFSANH